MSHKIDNPALELQVVTVGPARRIFQAVGTHFQLTKPERTLTNVLTAAAGFMFASSHNNARWLWLFWLLIGSTLVIASACVLNNYIDRGLDKKMARTKKRALPQGQVSVVSAIVYATILGLAGFVMLAFTNWLTFAVGATAFVGYVVLYGLGKRLTPYGTLIGTLPGGASLVAGYTTVTGRLDASALLLFIIMAAWQMAHFYAIAIYRFNDYKAADMPVWPVKYGIRNTKYQILAWIVAMAVALTLLPFFGYGGKIFVAAALAISLAWLGKALIGFNSKDDAAWARGVFFFSLKVVLVLAFLIAVGPLLP